MIKIIVILFCLLTALPVKAQKQFKTIAPQQPVVMGEAFQVQYIVEDGAKAGNFTTPVFPGFRIVSGPNIYYGSVKEGSVTPQSKNFVFTLVATKPGKLIIPGAFIYIDGRPLKSNSSFVEVISKEDATKLFDKEAAVSSDYFLRPGENVQDKIKKNLFVKVLVDKRSCFVGEPVLATFKLYSRLQSKSDIVKNPGFYGFTVYDMVNLADKQVATETVNGKPFDVHTIRKVQLYPLQPGVFTIDAMEVINKVEFSRSIVNKKTEQEIIEGVLVKDGAAEKKENTEEFENSISTDPVEINVKPLPLKNRPAAFEGITGRFSINANVFKKELLKNEEGFLEITISGKGNFIQIPSLSVSWPAGIEVFEPVIKDQLDKSTSPLSGSRSFRYPFVCAAAGQYKLPQVSISFFNTDSNTYKTVLSDSITITVKNEDKSTLIKQKKTEIKSSGDWQPGKIAVGLALLLLAAFFYWRWNKRKPAASKIKQPVIPLAIDEMLQPAALFTSVQGNFFYITLNQLVWNYFATRFELRGSEANKANLLSLMQTKGINNKLAEETKIILEQLETGMYADVLLTEDKEKILADTKSLLKQIDSYFLKQA